MRMGSTFLVAVVIAVITCSLRAPSANGQNAADIVDEVLNLFNNNSSSNNSNSNSNNSSNSGPRNQAGMFANAFDSVDPNTGYRSEVFPAGTRVKIQGAGTTAQTFRLPASVVVMADGSLGQLGATVNGNRLILDNRSPDGLDLEFILPGGGGSGPVSRPPVNPNNRSSVGIGNVEVRNMSGVSVTVRYKLPTGKTYFYDNRNNMDLYASLGPGRKDETPGIAENTRVTVDGYVEEFYVLRDANLLLIIQGNNITAQSTPLAFPNPAPNTPLPAPNPPSSPAPNPSPISGPVASVPQNTIPTVQTTPLTSTVAVALAQRINKEVKQLLYDFDQASTKRLVALTMELGAAGFPEEGAAAISGAARDGDATKTSEFFKEHRPTNANLPRTLETNCLAIATFRKAFTDLLAKIEAGATATEMETEFQAIRLRATNLGASGLADAMTLTQRDLVIRDTVNRASISSVLTVGEPSVPTGLVTVIRHPWVEGPAIHLGSSGVILVRANDERIIVSQSSAGVALGLPTSADTPVPDSQATSPTKDITILNPPTSQTAQNYLLNGTPYSLQPGQTQTLPTSTSWQVEFRSGAGTTTKRYSLAAAGTYAFVFNDGLWDLRTQDNNIRLHNPVSNGTTLRYLVDGSSAELAAGATSELKSSVPLLIQFDRGNGLATATKLVSSRGDFYFALNRDSQWELFPGTSPTVKNVDANQLVIARPSLVSLRQAAGSLLFDFTGNEVASPAGTDLLDKLKSVQ